MATVTLSGAYDLQALLADVADTGPTDILIDDFGTTQFSMDGGLLGTITTLTFGGPVFYLLTITAPEGNIATVVETLPGQPADVFDVGSFLAATASSYISTDTGATIEAFGTDDTLQGVGTFRGQGGNDTIILEASGTTDRSFAFGNNGQDTIYSEAERATLNGGNGNDTIEVGTGVARIIGGGGADEFYFDSGVFNGTSTTGRLFATIFDFTTGQDALFFNQDDSSATPGAPTTTSIADVFGADVLSTTGPQIFDGVRYTFSEASDGDALITRRGFDSEGNFYRENVRLDGVGLDDLDANEIFIVEYNNDPFLV